jgi:ionotropic glutamate receptor NMDA 2B
MGKSLTFRGTVNEASQLMKTHRCKDPICDTHLWKVKHELDLAKVKMRTLEDEIRKRGIAPIDTTGSVGKSVDSRFVSEC